MQSRTRRRVAPLVLVLVAGLVAGACAAPNTAANNPGGVVVHDSDSGKYRGNYYPNDPETMPDVTLTGTSGQPFNLRADTDKSLTLVFFGFTNCPDVCPTTLANVASALRRMDPQTSNKVELVFITSDPKRDTRRAIRTYLDRFHPSYVGLRGPMDTIEKAADPLKVSISATTKPNGDYNVSHTGQLFGFLPNDKAPILWTPGTPVGDLEHDFTKLVRSTT